MNVGGIPPLTRYILDIHLGGCTVETEYILSMKGPFHQPVGTLAAKKRPVPFSRGASCIST